MGKAGRDQVIRILGQKYHADPRVGAVYLFGSVASEKTWPRSDVDVAFLLAGVEGLEIDNFILKEMGALGSLFRSDVDVVVLNRCSHLMRMQVFKKGLLVFERDPLTHRRFRAEAMIAAADFLPFWKRHVEASLRMHLAPYLG